ncbi:hypothetical protein cypCar_00029798 [Cyprinus carpio]|nr:hypothetical protein cypCar_00029798 [Cyprinus carpio]
MSKAQSASQSDVKKPQESSAVVLENLPDDIKQDVLSLLVENISSLSENDFSIELIPELSKAVVTFINPIAAEKFLENSRTHEKFKKNNLRARALERSTSVRVENLPAEANKNNMLLELYFEKWGGPVEEVIKISSEQAAIIIFKEEEAKQRVLKRENNICDVPVKIYPYFKSLDTILYGGKRPHIKLPEPITVSVHPAIREFILKKGQISSIKDQMSSHFCQINMDKPEVLLSPDPALLKQKGVTRGHIDGWNKNAIDAFKKIISNYTTSEWPVSHALWFNVESDIRKVVKDQVFTDFDASKGVLTLAGMTHELIGLKPIMEKILERATNQNKREKNSVTDFMEISPAEYSLLERDGLKSATAVSPHLLVDYNKKMNRLVLSGLHTETLAIKNWVLEKKANVIVNTISEDLDLSKGAVSKALLQTAGYQLQSEINIVARSNGVNYGEMLITDGYELKCQKVFNVVCPFWRQGSEDKVLIQIIRDCLNKAESMRKASVVFPAIGTGNLGFPKDLVARIMLTEVQEFKPINLRKVTVVVDPSDKESIECFTSIFRHGIQGPVTQEAHQYALPDISSKSAQKSELVGKVSSPSLGVHTMQLGQVILEVSSGDITKEKTDAIVNSSNYAFSLKAVSKAILDAAGVQVEQECSQIGQGGANPADVADAMVDAVVDFAKNKKPVHVKFVKFLMFQSNMVADFHQSMVRGSEESSESSTNEEFGIVGEEIEPAVFQLCGETPKDLSEAKDMINSLILQEHVTIPIHDPAIAHFTRKDVETLNAMQRELTVSVRLEKKGQDSVITLEGLTRDVHTANSRIRDMIRKVEKNQNQRSEAFIISSVIKWQYQENGHSIENFDIFTNYELEQAFQKRQPSVRIKINNDEYEADLVLKVATRGKLKFALNRVEL